MSDKIDRAGLPWQVASTTQVVAAISDSRHRRIAEFYRMAGNDPEGVAEFVCTLVNQQDPLRAENERQGPCVWCSIAEQAHQAEEAELRAEVEQLKRGREQDIAELIETGKMLELERGEVERLRSLVKTLLHKP